MVFHLQEIGFNHQNYTSIDEFKIELCEYIKSKGIDCIIK